MSALLTPGLALGRHFRDLARRRRASTRTETRRTKGSRGYDPYEEYFVFRQREFSLSTAVRPLF